MFLLLYDVLIVFVLFLTVANIITSVMCASRVAFSTVGSSSSKWERSALPVCKGTEKETHNKKISTALDRLSF